MEQNFQQPNSDTSDVEQISAQHQRYSPPQAASGLVLNYIASGVLGILIPVIVVALPGVVVYFLAQRYETDVRLGVVQTINIAYAVIVLIYILMLISSWGMFFFYKATDKPVPAKVLGLCVHASAGMLALLLMMIVSLLVEV